VTPAPPLDLDQANVRQYVEQVVVPAVAPHARVVDVREVTEHTYVCWIFVARIQDGDGEQTLYLRQTRAHVKAKPEFRMDPSRIGVEVRILNLLAEMIPEVTPGVLFHDASNNVAVLSDVKREGLVLVEELVAGRSHPDSGEYFGEQVGLVHVKTLNIEHRLVRGSAGANRDAVEFHLGMRMQPALTRFPDPTQRLLADSQSSVSCLVLGDLGSKNIFVDRGLIRFVDLERAFVGDPAFDPAFLFSHYLVEVPSSAVGSAVAFVRNFMRAYRRAWHGVAPSYDLDGLENRVIRFLGATILYRIYGFYLAVEVQVDRNVWEDIGLHLLNDTSSTSVESALEAAMASHSAAHRGR
jgi:Phosphotransferase enzyme family